MPTVEIDPAFADLPLLDALAILWPDRSKDGIRELFARGAVRAEGRPVSPTARAGEAGPLDLRADPAELPPIHLAASEESSGVRVLHEDERIVVLEKPSGVPVVPDRARESPSCLGFLVRRELASRSMKPPAAHRRDRVVHRIDRLTSGLVVLARTLEAESTLARWFERGEVRKEYLALLDGEVRPARIDVDVPVGPGRKGKMRAGPEGKPSLTEFEVLERFRGFTLVRARPRTGRTHQIRVHAWAIGHPLAVDPLYRVGENARLPGPPGIRRLTLHAERLVLPAAWGEPRDFRAPWPEDLEEALRELRGSGGRADLRSTPETSHPPSSPLPGAW